MQKYISHISDRLILRFDFDSVQQNNSLKPS